MRARRTSCSNSPRITSGMDLLDVSGVIRFQGFPCRLLTLTKDTLMTCDRRPHGLFALALLFSAVTSLNAQPQAVLERDAQVAQLALEAASRGPAAPVPL